jgi:hypothetical protein
VRGAVLLGILLLVYWYLNPPYWRTIPFRPYFPDQSYFSDHADNGIPVGYSAALVAMGEPSLWRISRHERGAAYRFLRVPSSVGRSYAVRITRTGNGAELRMIELEEESGSQTKPARAEKRVSLSLAQWADLDNLAERARFWEMPSLDDRAISDGTALIVEGVRGGLYHGVHRQSPPPGPYLRLCCYLLALSGPGHPILMGNREPLPVGLGHFALVKTRNLALAVRFLEHTRIGRGGSDYGGASYEWFLQADGSGDFNRDNLASGKSEALVDPAHPWDQVVIACGPLTLKWTQCYTDSDYVSVQRADCKIDPFDVVAIAASDWGQRSEVQIDNKYLIWSVND